MGLRPSCGHTLILTAERRRNPHGDMTVESAVKILRYLLGTGNLHKSHGDYDSVAISNPSTDHEISSRPTPSSVAAAGLPSLEPGPYFASKSSVETYVIRCVQDKHCCPVRLGIPRDW